jgi:hypothetical protein
MPRRIFFRAPYEHPSSITKALRRANRELWKNESGIKKSSKHSNISQKVKSDTLVYDTLVSSVVFQ